MTQVQKTDKIFIPFNLIEIGDQFVLVPDKFTQSFIKGEDTRKNISLNSGHLSQIYVFSSHTPTALINCAKVGNLKDFTEIALRLGHKDTNDDISLMYKNIRQNCMDPLQVSAINFDNDHGFFDDIF